MAVTASGIVAGEQPLNPPVSLSAETPSNCLQTSIVAYKKHNSRPKQPLDIIEHVDI